MCRFALLPLMSVLAAGPAVAQGGVLELDAATVAALDSLHVRIDGAPALRLRTAWGASVLVDPRLAPAGIRFRSRTGAAPRMDGLPFQLQMRSRATGTGALAGGILGGLTGVLYGRLAAGVAGTDGQPSGTGATLGTMALGGVLGAGVGAGLGGLIGALFPRWRTIYRHPGR